MAKLRNGEIELRNGDWLRNRDASRDAWLLKSYHMIHFAIFAIFPIRHFAIRHDQLGLPGSPSVT